MWGSVGTPPARRSTKEEEPDEGAVGEDVL